METQSTQRTQRKQGWGYTDSSSLSSAPSAPSAFQRQPLRLRVSETDGAKAAGAAEELEAGP